MSTTANIALAAVFLALIALALDLGGFAAGFAWVAQVALVVLIVMAAATFLMRMIRSN